ncbi:hypothetical protein HPB48_002653 [Haemaphysalis longicornis]|uniref:SH3 domain-containing protein n=1 Tax=Haemaphysalis longicornis TaxID=44386 RepID=A0A9J6G2G4_HAELO|nr:hypothetical protein HPB48_002653 [Haemaphysalis longicornis]
MSAFPVVTAACTKKAFLAFVSPTLRVCCASHRALLRPPLLCQGGLLLLAHVNDPTLDDSTPREYILYLCPVGPLLEQLQKFSLQSMLQCGRNGAHNYLPHITLCSFFQVEPYLKALHITLAYQFQLEHYATLEKLSQAINTNATACWEIRLYSRDTRIKGSEVHKVLYSHVPKEPDELELLIGDFVYVSGEHLGAASDGWVEGTSWLTGATGFLPKNYIERTAESDAWTLHRSITIVKDMFIDGLDDGVLPRRPMVAAAQAPPSPQVSPKAAVAAVAAAAAPSPQAVEREEKVTTPPKEIIYENLGFLNQAVRNYTRRDLNMPNAVPERTGGYQDYAKDSPLTKIGLYQATLTGTAMSESGVTFTHVFASPSLRCIQTCTNILAALHFDEVLINVEPGLFEWLAWYPEGTPAWMSPAELKKLGFHINLDYQPLIEADDLRHKKESVEQYYMRSFYVAQGALKRTAAEGGNVLLVGHAATLETCTRQLTGRKPRSAAELVQLVHKIPYCGLCVAQEVVGSDAAGGDGASAASWALVAPPIPPLTHSANARFDWRCMT